MTQKERLFFENKNISEFKIVYGKCKDGTLFNAASDLAKYLNEAYDTCLSPVPDSDFSGELNNIIFVGPTRFDTLKVKEACLKLYNNGIAIVADKGNLYLTGENATGAMYAVYTFLEDYVGWRFYSSRFEKLVPRDIIDMPSDICLAYSPKIFSRDTFWYDSFDIRFASKQKLNGGFKRSGKGFGQLITYAGGFVHTLPGLAGTSPSPNDQPCLTDPLIYEKVLKNVKDLLKANPDAKIISVSQNDSYVDGLGCRCENCRAIDEREGTPMGSLLTFVNRIARDIKDGYPGVYVDTLAYRYTRKAPKTIKPEDNVIIRLCSIECCFSHPIGVGSCPQNDAFRKDLEDWSKISKNLFIWDYTTDFLFYLIPFPNLGVLYDNVRFFAAHNAVGLFEQGNGQSYSGEFGELRAYMLAKIMWDPSMTKERYNGIMDDFLEGYYGKGWKYIKEYILRTGELSSESHMGIYDRVENNLTLEGKDEYNVINGLEKLFDKALELADEDHYDNVLRSSLQIKYAKLLRLWDNDKSPEKLMELYGLLKKYGITHFREGVKLPENIDYTKPLIKW